MGKKKLFYELILECPYIHPVNSCPFNQFRKMSITELIDVTSNLKSTEITSLIHQHKACLKKSEAEKKRIQKVNLKSISGD